MELQLPVGPFVSNSPMVYDLLQSALFSLSPNQEPIRRNNSDTPRFADDRLAERGKAPSNAKRSWDSSDSEHDRDRSRHRSKRQKPKSDSRMDSTVRTTLFIDFATLTVFQVTDRRSRMRETLMNLVRNKNSEMTVSLYKS